MNKSVSQHREAMFAPLRVLVLSLVAAWLGTSASLTAQTWTNTSLSAEQRADALVAAMTLADKIAMVHGAGGSYVGNVAANAGLGIPALTLQDGPAGVRVGDNTTTALPAPISIGASWDVGLARQYGALMGEECRGKGVHVLLAPMMNIARVYQAGRNFEGYGEDPRLASAIASATVQGIQSQQVIATAKHFIGNEQETDRGSASSDVSERALQEIYLQPFRASARAGVGAAMASYNRLNGRYACESETLNATLRKLFGFDGFVMSDWGAGFGAVAGADNGMDLEMPGDARFGSWLQSAVQTGLVPVTELDQMAHRILATMFRFGVFDNPPGGNLSSNVTSAAHNLFARDAAAQGMVLLKNGHNALPLNPSPGQTIAVIGSVASSAPIPTGCGSASVNLPYHITPLAGISNRAGGGINITYRQGDGGNIAPAVSVASTSHVAIVCVGQQTCEGWDRSNLSLPGDQDALVSAVAAVNTNTVVVLYSSAPTLMPWAGQVAGIVAAWYPGQENGSALARVLFGDVNPSGKLPMTFPAASNEVATATIAQFPGVRGRVAYSEELNVGHRWNDANNVTPLFPFGHGLSFTTFGHSNLTVGAVSAAGQVQVGFDLSNTGSRTGAEVAQLYLGFPAAAGEPPKLLKDFQKILLAPGQAQRVIFNLGWEDLANWDAATRGWVVTPGEFQVMIGASSRDIRLQGSFTVSSNIPSSDLANAALHRTMTASSVLSTNTPGSAAVDGNTVTAWTSAASDPQWIYADLGFIRDISRIRLQWSSNHALNYSLQLSSNATSWNTVYSTTSGGGGVEDVLAPGRGRYVRMLGAQRAGAGGYSLAEFEVYPQPQRPFGGTAHPLPGRIQAEDYDLGGDGVAYHDDSTGNSGGAYRTDEADLETANDTGGGHDVGWIGPGEWLEYTVTTPDAPAIYSVGLRVASIATGQMRVRLDGTVLGTVQIPNTGGWQSWQTVTLPDVPIGAGSGSRALRLEMLTGGFNLNWIEFNRRQICGTNNLALDRPATSSSIESASYGPANAVDGDPRTRWSSAFSDPQWLSVDLGTTQNIARVKLDWETAFSRSYRIELSTNGSAWTTAYSTTNGPGSINDLAVPGSARYVRLYSTQRGTPWGNSTWELEVYPAVPPEPAIHLEGGTAVVKWPVTFANWTLESALSLNPAGNWLTVTSPVFTVNSEYFITAPATNPSVFFRLRAP